MGAAFLGSSVVTALEQVVLTLLAVYVGHRLSRSRSTTRARHEYAVKALVGAYQRLSALVVCSSESRATVEELTAILTSVALFGELATAQCAETVHREIEENRHRFVAGNRSYQVLLTTLRENIRSQLGLPVENRGPTRTSLRVRAANEAD